jgi:hypothetical protein
MFSRKLFSKTFFVLLSATLLACSISSPALAQVPQPGDTQRGGFRSSGEITAIDADRFTLQTGAGSLITILVDENTRYRDTQWNTLAFTDLQVGNWVTGSARYNAQGELVARVVILLPENFDPGQRLGKKARGHVIGVNLPAGTFTIHTGREENLEFSVNENTVFRGQVEGLEDVQPGMIALVAGITQPDGKLLAVAVSARVELVRHVGKVDQVDLPAASFTLRTLRSGETTFDVDAETRFLSPDGSVTSLADLTPGMVLRVRSQQIAAGKLLAREVIVVSVASEG